MELALENNENVPNLQTTNGKVTHVKFAKVPDIVKFKYDDVLESTDSIIYDIDRALCDFTTQPSKKRMLLESQTPDRQKKNIKAAPLKIVFNRNTPSTNSVESPKIIPTADGNSKSNAPKPERKIIDLSGLGAKDAKERLTLKTKKFGTILPTQATKIAGTYKVIWTTSSQAKKVERTQTWTGNSTSSRYRMVKSPVTKIDVLKQRAAMLKGSMSSLITKIESQVKLQKKKAMFGAGSGSNGLPPCEKPHLKPKRNSM